MVDIPNAAREYLGSAYGFPAMNGAGIVNDIYRGVAYVVLGLAPASTLIEAIGRELSSAVRLVGDVVSIATSPGMPGPEHEGGIPAFLEVTCKTLGQATGALINLVQAAASMPSPNDASATTMVAATTTDLAPPILTKSNL
jgi:hypothetical protein